MPNPGRWTGTSSEWPPECFAGRGATVRLFHRPPSNYVLADAGQSSEPDSDGARTYQLVGARNSRLAHSPGYRYAHNDTHDCRGFADRAGEPAPVDPGRMLRPAVLVSR